MKLRVARHTKDLESIQKFYLLIPGMEVLGSFKDHQGYAGVFLGTREGDWHLEFTVSEDVPTHAPDEDDLLVFYAKSSEDYETMIEKFRTNDIEEVNPRNPFWKENGTTFLDPDGFRIVVAKFLGSDA